MLNNATHLFLLLLNHNYTVSKKPGNFNCKQEVQILNNKEFNLR